MKIYSIYNIHQLLIILLKYKITSDDLVILTSKLGSVSLDKSIYNYFILKNINVFISKNQGIKNRVLRCLNYIFNHIRLDYKLNLITRKSNITEYIGDDTDMAIFSSFYCKYPITLIEDGTANYTSYETIQKSSYKNKLLKKIIYDFCLIGNMGEYRIYGYDKYINHIVLTGISQVPDELKDKVELVSLDYLWNRLDSKYRNEINNIFEFDFELFNNKTIFLLQEFERFSEEFEVDYNLELLSKYNKNEIVIKAHPRQKESFINKIKKNGYEVCMSSFPAELIFLNRVMIKKIITICSSAAYNFIGYCDVEILGTEYFNKICNKIGYIEYKFYKKV